MEIKTYACDGEGCQVQKKDSNHWWKGFVLRSGGVVVVAWSAALETTLSGLQSGPVKHLCGEQCVAQFVSKHLNSESVPSA